MSAYLEPPDPTSELSRKAAIVGIGETDFAIDYRAEHQTGTQTDLASRVDSLMSLALDRALEDAGLHRRDIDGVYLMPEMVEPSQRSIKALGLAPTFVQYGGWLNHLGNAAALLAADRAKTVALIFAAPFRSAARVFGGTDWHGAARDSYYYYHPWRWSSQAAHWALMYQRYVSKHRVDPDDLGHVAVSLRRHAMLAENSIMTEPLTVDEYCSSRYIVQPLRRLDICLVNDGAVCVIMQHADVAKRGPHDPVFIAGWAYEAVRHSKLECMVKQLLQPLLAIAGSQALDMAGMSLGDIGHAALYDPSSIQLVNQLEGFGFVMPGEGLDFIKDGNIGLNGALPANTSGGMLSQSYMAGWNNLVEVVRQLRHEAGERQVPGVNASLFATSTTDTTNPYVLTRGDERG